MEYLKMKTDNGGDYIVTQMFFDNKRYFAFVDYCRSIGIEAPIVAGLKPITKRYQLTSIPRKFFVNIPSDLAKAVSAAKDEEAVRQVGIEWSIQQSKELKASGIPCLHYYTMGDTATIRAIA